jgi:hypothetical protein
MTENEAIVAASGQVSHALLQHLRPIFSEHEKRVMQKMKMLYREGNLDHMKLSALVAELCAIEDLGETLNSRVRGAAKIEKRMHEEGSV